MNLRLQPDTLPLLRLPLTTATRRRSWRRLWAMVKNLVFFGLILPLLVAGAVLFLATFGP